MYEIIKGNANLANKLLNNHSDMMFAGIVAGNNLGRMWVDNLEDPASAIVWSEGLQCFQFMGCANNQAFTDKSNHNFRKMIETSLPCPYNLYP